MLRVHGPFPLIWINDRPGSRSLGCWKSTPTRRRTSEAGASYLEVRATFSNGRQFLQRVALGNGAEPDARAVLSRIASERDLEIGWAANQAG